MTFSAVITSDAAAIADSGYAGFIEQTDPFVLGGWVANARSEAQPIEIVLNDRVLCSLVPTLPRPDLSEAIGSGVPAGFFIDVAEYLVRDAAARSVLEQMPCNGNVSLNVRLSGRDDRLSPGNIEWDRTALRAAVEALRESLVRPNLNADSRSGTFGCVESIDLHGVAGWALCVDDPEPLDVRVELGGRVVATGRTHLVRSDVAAILGREARCGFLLTWTEAAWDVFSLLEDETVARVGVYVEPSGRRLQSLAAETMTGRLVRRWLRSEAVTAPRPIPSEPPTSILDADSFDRVDRYFDADYYARVYQDVASAKVDPLRHYLSTGWREGRDPSAEFDTNYYARTNADVAAGECPLSHYARRGRREGRLPQDITRRHLNLIAEQRRAEPEEPLTHPGPPLSESAICRFLRAALEQAPDRLVISASHDVYRENTGGIQVLLADEERLFVEGGSAYIGVAPARPLLTLLDQSEQDGYEVVLTTNGKVRGRASFQRLANAVGTILSSDAHREVVLVAHSLLGHAPASLEALWSALDNPKTAYLWVHDYAALCPSFSLMRNDAVYCHAPPSTSPGCMICEHGAGRPRHSKAIRQLLEVIPFRVIAPSEAALGVFRRGGLPEPRGAVVHPHAELTPIEETPDARAHSLRQESAVVRVAYCGYPLVHKGWHLFRMLVDGFWDDDRFEFHHFGAQSTGDARLLHHEVRVSGERREAMIHALRRSEIDVVLVPSLWPETFCFVAYEAVAAGCAIVTLARSGNAASLARASGRGAVFESPEELARAFADGRVRDLAQREPRRYHMKIIGTTATLDEVAR